MMFAHQGGWDEMLMVLVPVALVVLLLRLANRRVAQQRPAGQVKAEGEADGQAEGQAESVDRPPNRR